MSPPAAPSGLSRADLEAQGADLRGEVAAQKRLVVVLRDENARLKGRPVIKPSGMEDTGRAEAPGQTGQAPRPRQGGATGRH